MSAIDWMSWEFVNTPQPVGGLVQLQFRLQATDAAGREMKARVRLGGAHAGERSFRLDGEGKGAPWFALHTQVLDDGEYALDAELLDSERNEVLWTGRVPFSVVNVGELSSSVTASLRAHSTPLFVESDCDTGAYDYSDTSLVPWFDRPDAFETIANWETAGELSAGEAKQFRQFVEEGYIVLEGLIDDELVDAVNGEIDRAVAAGYRGYEYGSSQRIEHLHVDNPNIRRLFLDRRYLNVLDKLFRAKARPCQTLTYLFGSQQDAHQDTVHLTPFPAGYMCGVWIALQDVVPDSGELVVYPRSHRLPRVYMRDVECEKVRGEWKEFGEKVVGRWQKLIDDGGFRPETYLPKKGTVLIWHENLMHAGSKRRDTSLTRRSIVIHCFADGAIVFYDSTGLVGFALHRDQVPDS